MRKKITSLSLLLFSGALVLTSCVKNEEEESTKALRTAQEQRAKEKLAEEKTQKAAELEQTKKALVASLVERKTAILGEIATEKANIVTAQNENADRTASKATLQSKVDLAAEKLARNLESYNRQIAAKEHEKTVVAAANLADVVALNNQIKTKQTAKELATQQQEVASQAYTNAKATVVKAFTNGLLATNLVKALYKNNGDGTYSPITDPDVFAYVKNFANVGNLDYSGITPTALAARTTTLVNSDNDATKPTSGGYTFTDLIAKKQIALQDLNNLQASIVAATPERPDYTTLDTAIANAQADVTSARATYNADPTTANRNAYEAALRALQTAQNAKTTAQENYATALKTATKLRAAQTALTADGNVAAVNRVITTFNSALTGLAQKNAALLTLRDKVSLLDAEINALVALGGTTNGDISGAKAELIKAINNAITDLKEAKRAAEEAHANVVKTNITEKTRDTTAKNAEIAASQAIIAAKTAELNYVNAQLTALGVK